MPPIDDFFAFTNDDFGSPQQQKKKKKKKKVKSIETDEVGNGKVLKKEEASFLSVATRNPVFSLNTNSGAQPIEDDTKDEAALTDLLGLSVSSPELITDSNISVEVPKSDENVNSTLTDREARQLNRSAKANGPEIKIASDPVSVVGNNAAADPDDFLSSISSYVTSIKEKEHEIQDLLQSHQQEDIVINGIKISSKSVKFEFHIDIQAAGQVSGSYDLQVKGSTKISKIVNTLMPLFNKEANPQCPDNEWETLVMYVKNLNIILSPSLRCMSLLGYKNQLNSSVNGADFELYAIITTEEYAQMLLDAERKKRLEEIATNLEKDNEADDAFFKVKIIDRQKEKVQGKQNDVICLDMEDGNSHEKMKTKLNEEFGESMSSNLSVLQSMPVSELLMLYKYKAHLPSELNVTIFLDDTLVDTAKKLSELNVTENQIFEIKYSVDELKELRDKDVAGDESYNGEEGEEDDLEEIRKGAQGTENLLFEQNGLETEYFSIFVAGKDKKRFKVNVKPSTNISDISKFYVQKAGLPVNTVIKLLFDDEDLDLNATVADTELEDEFMIDAVILGN